MVRQRTKGIGTMRKLDRVKRSGKPALVKRKRRPFRDSCQEFLTRVAAATIPDKSRGSYLAAQIQQTHPHRIGALLLLLES
jgi:hypothetical protein